MSEASSESPRLLVAGIGNIFLGDDAFGVEVVQRLARRALPPSVRVVDFGIRGFDLACALLERYDAVILVDAMPRGQAPGTLYVLEPEVDESDCDPLIEMHSLDPVKVVRVARSLGAPSHSLFVVGCEPANARSDDMQAGLSEPVQRSLDEAVTLVEELALRLLGGSPSLAGASAAGILSNGRESSHEDQEHVKHDA
jgi:hydrogenase maturation protease